MEKKVEKIFLATLGWRCRWCLELDFPAFLPLLISYSNIARVHDLRLVFIVS